MNYHEKYIKYKKKYTIMKRMQKGGVVDINQNWYNMNIHYEMLRDYNRMKSYYQFIKNSKWIKDKICCDLGSGTGILSLFALKAGARHVHIVENQKNMIDVIKKLLENNSIPADKYTIYQGWSTDVILNEKVDCIIHELIGIWGNGENGLGYVAEFRDRFLKEGGNIIPDIIEVNITLQHTNHYYNQMEGSNFDFMKEMNLDNLFQNVNKSYSSYINLYNNKTLSIINNDFNYIKSTSNCNTETIKFNLNEDSVQRFKSLEKQLNFQPNSNKVVSLICTIKYYCSDKPEIYGDSSKYNTNWRKQMLLFQPIDIKSDDLIKGKIKMYDYPNSTTEQIIEIELSKNDRKFYNNKFRSISDNMWIFDFDPVSMGGFFY